MVATGSPAGREGLRGRLMPPHQVPRRRLGARRVGGLIAGMALLGLLGGCSIDQAFHFGWPTDRITVQSERMFNLWIGSVIAALAVGVFVWGLIFWCIIRYRKRGDQLPAQTRYNLPIELIYSVVPFLIISVLFYYTAVIQTDVDRVDNPDVTVSVEAFQWNWKFSYDGTTGPDGQPVSTLGTDDYIPVLVVPTDKKVLFVEHSRDVIHSFWVPQMLFKRDVFPGNVTNRFQTTIVKEGAYVGRCAELCGVYHSMMNFEVRAVTWEKYQRFIDAKESGMSTPDALKSIGEAPLAVKTHPFTTERQAS